jgi:hypothetical protein
MNSAPDSRNRWALLIGINEYPLLKPRGQLTGCINDVEVMSRTLQGPFGFPGDHVTILRDAEATRDGILAAMYGLAERVEKDDVVVFHYSGHGSRMPDREGDEPDGFDQTLFPYDAGRAPHPNREITDDEIYLWLQKLTALTPHVTLIFDCCHSGTIVRDVFGETERWVEEETRPIEELPPSPVLAQARLLRENTREVGPSGWLPLGERYVLIAGCGHAEKSYEVGVGEVRHGALTYFLTRELIQASPGSTYRDILEKVAPIVTSHFPSQHPQLEGARDREIFGVGTIEPMAFAPVLARKGDRLVLGAGASWGLTAGSQWSVHPPGTKRADEGEPLGKVTVSKVGAVTSEATIVEESRPDTIAVGARAVESSRFLGATRLAVEVMVPVGKPAALELFTRIGQSRLLRQAEKGETADARIYLLPPRFGAREGDPAPALGALREDTWAVVGPHGNLLMLPRPHHDYKAVTAIVENLEGRARFQHTAALANDRSTLAGMVDLKVLRRLGNGEWGELEVGVDGEPVLFDGDQFCLEITNRALRPLYMYVLNLGSGGGVSQLYPIVQGDEKALAAGHDPALDPSLPPGRTFRARVRSGEEVEMCFPEEILASWHLLGIPSLEGRETMKLFATTQPADFRILLQPGYLRSEAGDSLTSLLIDIVEGGRREVRQRSPEDDWVTVQRTFRLKPPKPVVYRGVAVG